MDNDPGVDRTDQPSRSRSPSPSDPTLGTTSEPLAAGPHDDRRDEQDPSTASAMLPSFSELMQSLASRPPRAPHAPPPGALQSPDGGLRLTPVFSEHPLVQSPTRVRFPSTQASPTRAGPPGESTVIRPPRQQGNNALAPAPTTRVFGLETRVDSSLESSALTTRGDPQYRIPHPHQRPHATTSESTQGSQSRNFQFYLVDRTAPRTYRACTHCRQRKVKCETDPSRNRCRRCIDRGLRCEEAIPISPLVGNLLSSDRDLAPMYRKHRSESDPTLPRNYPADDNLDPETQAKLKELFTDPDTGEYRVPSILQPAESSSTINRSSNRMVETVDLTRETSESPTRHRHTLSSEYRSSHRHNPIGTSDRRSRLISRADQRKEILGSSGVRDAKEASSKGASSGKDSQTRPRSYSGPVLRTSSHIRSHLRSTELQAGPSRLPDPGHHMHTHSAPSPVASPPTTPLSPQTTGRVGAGTPPTVTRGQRPIRTHRRHVTSIQGLPSPTDNPSDSLVSPDSEAGASSGNRPVITLIRLIPAESLVESTGGLLAEASQQVRFGSRATSVEPIQVDSERDDREKNDDR